jgi:hypothetical protein
VILEKLIFSGDIHAHQAILVSIGVLAIANIVYWVMFYRKKPCILFGNDGIINK